MKSTRFSGPTLYSNEYPPLGGFPTRFNPDYFTFMDDFNGKVVDTTNYWTFDSISNGTLDIVDADHGTADPYDNIGFGMAEIRSEVVDPLTSNSGGTLYSFIQFQPFVRGQSVFFETRLGVNNPKNCDLFAGIAVSSPTIISNPFNFTTTANKAGFRLLASEGTGKLECVNGYIQTDSKILDFDMPNAFPLGLSSVAGETGNEGPIGIFTTPTLSIRVDHMASRGDPSPTAEYQVVIRYFVNRILVYTSVATEDNPTFANNNYSTVFAYKKVSNRTGITLQTDIDNVLEDKLVYIDVPGTNSVTGNGFSPGMYLKIDNEFFRVKRLVPYNRNGSQHQMLLAREQLGSTRAAHTAGASITQDSGSCFIDYSAVCVNRYPAYQDAPTVNSRYLVDGKGSR